MVLRDEEVSKQFHAFLVMELESGGKIKMRKKKKKKLGQSASGPIQKEIREIERKRKEK